MSPSNLFLVPVLLTAPLDIVKIGFAIGAYLCIRAYRSKHG